jgi:hypothetical protein
LKISSQLSHQHSAKPGVPLYDPLPTEQLKRKNRAEIGPDSTTEKHKKMASTARSTVRSNWGSAFVFNNGAMGGGVLAEGRRQRAVGDCQICQNRVIAKIEKQKPHHG